MEKLLQLLILVPYFFFFSWQRKVRPGSKHFSFLPLLFLLDLFTSHDLV